MPPGWKEATKTSALQNAHAVGARLEMTAASCGILPTTCHAGGRGFSAEHAQNNPGNGIQYQIFDLGVLLQRSRTLGRAR